MKISMTARLIYEEPKQLPDQIPFSIVEEGGSAPPIPLEVSLLVEKATMFEEALAHFQNSDRDKKTLAFLHLGKILGNTLEG